MCDYNYGEAVHMWILQDRDEILIAHHEEIYKGHSRYPPVKVVHSLVFGLSIVMLDACSISRGMSGTCFIANLD